MAFLEGKIFNKPFTPRGLASEVWCICAHRLVHDCSENPINSLQKSLRIYTGPAEITAFTAEALFVVNAPGSACEKPDWYDNILPMKSLINIRKKEEHDQRRKIWDKAFSVKGTTLYLF